jgi:PPOX class probable F420-dependent enzyme
MEGARLASIPESHKDLFERPVLASLATVQPDGGPQVTPVWVGLRDGHILVNTAAGRRKYHNLVDRKHATVMLLDPENAFRWIEVRGLVEDVIRDADDDINELSHKYLGTDYPGFVEGEERVTFLIKPDRVVAA